MLRHPSLHPLSHQHRDALALCVLIERGLPERRAELAQKAAGVFDLELRNHFDLEERLLFPAIREHLGSMPLVEELVAEHRRLEGMVERLPDSLEEFAELLSSHIRREERELFENIQDRLPPEVLEELGRVFRAEAVRVCISG